MLSQYTMYIPNVVQRSQTNDDVIKGNFGLITNESRRPIYPFPYTVLLPDWTMVLLKRLFYLTLFLFSFPQNVTNFIRIRDGNGVETMVFDLINNDFRTRFHIRINENLKRVIQMIVVV